VRELADAATMYRDTGGMHAAGLGVDGRLIIAREDVGRHNAVDKVLGRAWIDGIDTSRAVLVATGRISYEMAVKAAKARVPVAASRSAVTDLAAELGDGLASRSSATHAAASSPSTRIPNGCFTTPRRHA
jgi:FdhD protein